MFESTFLPVCDKVLIALRDENFDKIIVVIEKIGRATERLEELSDSKKMGPEAFREDGKQEKQFFAGTSRDFVVSPEL